MNLFILDTDHVTLYARGHPEVTPRVDVRPPDEVGVAVITVEEQLAGWYAQIRRAKKDDQRARAYQGLFDVTKLIKKFRVVPFTLLAIQRSQELRKSLPRCGRLDLAIAAIVLQVDATLVTRNRSDFEQVPGLRIEDWSKS
jgi:tRNA(fMet)-specific endonuclease VapC